MRGETFIHEHFDHSGAGRNLPAALPRAHPGTTPRPGHGRLQPLPPAFHRAGVGRSAQGYGYCDYPLGHAANRRMHARRRAAPAPAGPRRGHGGAHRQRSLLRAEHPRAQRQQRDGALCGGKRTGLYDRGHAPRGAAQRFHPRWQLGQAPGRANFALWQFHRPHRPGHRGSGTAFAARALRLHRARLRSLSAHGRAGALAFRGAMWL